MSGHAHEPGSSEQCPPTAFTEEFGSKVTEKALFDYYGDNVKFNVHLKNEPTTPHWEHRDLAR